MDYLDFNLKIGPRIGENLYAVAARSESMGETRATFTQPLTEDQLELFVLRVGLARRGVRRIHSAEWRAAQDFGQKLFRALFADQVGAAYLASHNDAVRQGKGLRVKLTLDAPELGNYPWEFLYDPSNNQFLSLFEDTPVLRYVELPRPILPLTVAPPLRILAIASSPTDYEPLDVAREHRNLTQALKHLLESGAIEIDWLPTATLDALREQLLKRPYHIFHFIGHGGFDRTQEDGIIIFENAGATSNRVSGERLAILLGNHRTLRLAMLNACEGARTSPQDPFAGTAMTLLQTGNLPAVVAMQFEITDNAAIDFAKGFYSAIASGRPVDAAVGQGRQAIFAHDNDVEWSTPVLYLRAQDGVIFQVDPGSAVVAPPPIQQAELPPVKSEPAEPEKTLAAAMIAKESDATTRPPQAMPESATPRTTAQSVASETADSAAAAGAADSPKVPLAPPSLPRLFAVSVAIWAAAYFIAGAIAGGDTVVVEVIGVVLGIAGMWLLWRSSHVPLSSESVLIILGGYVAAFLASFVIVGATVETVFPIMESIVVPLYNTYPDTLVLLLKYALTAGIYGAIQGALGGAVMWWQLQRERLMEDSGRKGG